MPLPRIPSGVSGDHPIFSMILYPEQPSRSLGLVGSDVGGDDVGGDDVVVSDFVEGMNGIAEADRVMIDTEF